MTGAMLTQLLIKFGPIALDWAEELVALWTTEMTPEQIKAFCLAKRKEYEAFIATERAKRV